MAKQGACLWCGENSTHKFCSLACREAAEKDQEVGPLLPPRAKNYNKHVWYKEKSPCIGCGWGNPNNCEYAEHCEYLRDFNKRNR